VNVLSNPWLPFRTREETIVYRSPSALADPDIIDLALPRADFQGAAYQFLLGLVQTALPPQDHGDWLDRFIEPPSIAELEADFAPFVAAFELDGEGPRFMQDLDPLEDVKDTTVSGLLIDAPGANGVKNNTDFFVKRGRVDAMCEDCAAIALFTMQINAPAGGAGIRVGLRGGGPLTTLIMPETIEASLWSRLWLNMLTPKTSTRQGQSWQAPRADDDTLFFWMAPTRVSDKKGTQVLPEQVHPLHPYWSMPRRFRLLFEDTPCRCDLCGRGSERSVRRIRAKKQGANYDGPWLHPLTPYRRDPKKPNEPPLSSKGQPGGLGYRHWPNLVLSDPDNSGALPAAVVQDYVANKVTIVDEERRAGEAIESLLKHARLWVFGFDLDQMKPRGWYSVEMPLVAVPPAQQDRLRDWVQRFGSLAMETAKTLRGQIKRAWLGTAVEARGDIGYLDMQFYEATEAAFYRSLAGMRDVLTAGHDRYDPALAQEWYQTLRTQALALFDANVLAGPLDELDMERLISARQYLLFWLLGGGKKRGPVATFAAQSGFELTSASAGNKKEQANG